MAVLLVLATVTLHFAMITNKCFVFFFGFVAILEIYNVKTR